MPGRSRYRSRGGRRSSYRSAGAERAMQHIREAEELTRELGGADQDVKQYFFNLSAGQRSHVLSLYGLKYGEEARQYAEQTIPRWESGQRKMAGQTASRLFNLLPPLMPIHEKYRLTESLWRHVGPQSKRRLRIGLDAAEADVIGKVQEHIEGVVSSYQIPEGLARRFDWITAGDVAVKQQLLNHLQVQEKALVVEGARQQLPVMLEHLRRDVAGDTKRLAQILKVGKHELEVLIDRNTSGASLEDWKPPTVQAPQSMTWLWWLIGIGAVVAFFALRKN